MTGVGVRVGAIGVSASRQVQASLDAAASGPAGRMELLNTAFTEIVVAQTRLRRVTPASGRWLLPPLRGARADLVDSLKNAETRLAEIHADVRSLQRMFLGPSYYLVLAGNNAEMRAGGMPLSAGVATLENGSIRVSAFIPTYQMLVRRGPVPVPEELQDLLGNFYVGAEYRGTSASPNFPVVAPIFKRMWDSTNTLATLDGVLFVDVVALGKVVDATGPVELDGITYTSKNIGQEVMNENYIRFGDTNELSARYDLQSRLGNEVFAAINNRAIDLGKFVAGLSSAGKGRHLLAWSADQGAQRVFVKAGLSGALLPNGLQVNLENISANKLDWHIKPSVYLRSLSVRRGIRRVEMSVTFKNDPRPRTSPVVEGTEYARSHGMADGEHRVQLLVYLPPTAFDIGAVAPPFTAAGTDGGLRVVGSRYGVKLGEQRTVKITFSVPKDQVFNVMPSARAHPVPYTTANGTVTDAEPVTIAL